jgi:hydroxypyruvate isomerase
MPRFSVHLDYLFTERPFLQRFDAAAAAGFGAIECRFPVGVPADQFRQAAERNKLSILGINTPTGGKGEFGFCAVPGREKEWQDTFEEALDYVTAVGASAVHCLAGKVLPEQYAAANKVFVENLKRAADQAAARNVKLLLEPINHYDQPDYFLTHADHAAEVIAKVGASNVFIQYDFYHVQIVDGDLIRRLEKLMPLIGHLQCSQVPVRNEPDDRGEINYPFVFAEVDRLGYQGWIGCEYRPRGKTEAGLGWGQAYGLKTAS